MESPTELNYITDDKSGESISSQGLQKIVSNTLLNEINSVKSEKHKIGSENNIPVYTSIVSLCDSDNSSKNLYNSSLFEHVNNNVNTEPSILDNKVNAGQRSGHDLLTQKHWYYSEINKSSKDDNIVDQLWVSLNFCKQAFAGIFTLCSEYLSKVFNEDSVKSESADQNKLVNNEIKCELVKVVSDKAKIYKYKRDILKAHAQCDIVSTYGLDFKSIRDYCESDSKSGDIDLHPINFLNYKKDFWPDFIYDGPYQCSDYIGYVYQQVKESGLPNAIGEQVDVASNLNLDKWEFYLSDNKYAELKNQLRYGFSLGYSGPISSHTYTSNHSSDTNFPEQVEKFIKKDVELGSLCGPFESLPFEWAHINPLLSRKKNNSNDRRIIMDMTFPSEFSINSFIPKTQAFGILRSHELPKIDDIVKTVLNGKNNQDFYLSSFDLINAYKNFRVCPLDFPLMMLKWENSYYLEVALPFGSRLSSMWMQKIADAIVDILKAKNITSFMYLDDLLVISPNRHTAESQVATVFKIFEELGLPLNRSKFQGPTKTLTWIGVEICLKNYTLSVPLEKLNKTLKIAQSVYSKKSVSKDELESIIGKLIHISKCIKTTRIFTSRLLRALRDIKGKMVIIDQPVRLDLEWFISLATSWNGITFLQEKTQKRYIYTVFKESKILAFDENNHFIIDVSHIKDSGVHHKKWRIHVFNICVAIKSFIQNSDANKNVYIVTSSKKASLAFNFGNSKDYYVDNAIRKLWFDVAMCNFDYSVIMNDTVQNLPCEIYGEAPMSQLENSISRVGSHLKLPPMHDWIKFYNLIFSRPRVEYTSQASRG